MIAIADTLMLRHISSYIQDQKQETSKLSFFHLWTGDPISATVDLCEFKVDI